MTLDTFGSLADAFNVSSHAGGGGPHLLGSRINQFYRRIPGKTYGNGEPPLTPSTYADAFNVTRTDPGYQKGDSIFTGINDYAGVIPHVPPPQSTNSAGYTKRGRVPAPNNQEG